jgi:hypothetical protein
MNVSSRKRLFVSVVAIVALVMVLGQTTVFAQSSRPAGQNPTPTSTISRLFDGGAFQIVDTAGAPCSGQCAVANWQTAACTCPSGFSAFPAARILIDVGTGAEGSTCGSFLYICGAP